MRDDPALSWGQSVWRQLRRRPLAWGALWATATLFVLAVVAPVIASDQPFVWRTAAGWSSPWLVSLYDHDRYTTGVDFLFNTLLLPGLPLAGLAWAATRFGRLRGDVVFGAWLALWLGGFTAVQVREATHPKVNWSALHATLTSEGEAVTAAFPPLRQSYLTTDITQALKPPSAAHPLGTDNEGGDTFTRLLYGIRISLTIGVFAVALYCTVGCVLGGLAGYYGGRVDLVISTLIEVVMCVPQLLLVLSAAAILDEPGVFHIMGLIAAVSWTGPARLVRAEFLKLRELDFVTAARARGYPPRTIIFAEILPNAIGPLLVSATFGVAGAILVESTMAVLGLGASNAPSWGGMLNVGRNVDNWRLILVPGLAIFGTVSLLNLVGEGVRDALDPRLRG